MSRLVAVYGSFNRVKVEGALNLALSETVALRVSAIGDFHDDIANNRAGPDLWNRNEYGGRVQLLLEPNDDLSVLFNLRGGMPAPSPARKKWSSSTATIMGKTTSFCWV